MNSKPYDIAIIGGGIVGMATAMALATSSHQNLVVLEAEDRLAAHQTGNNRLKDPIGIKAIKMK